MNIGMMKCTFHYSILATLTTMTPTLTVSNTLSKTNFYFPKQTGVYYGKVRDVYTIDNHLLVMLVTDRISAFDVVLPKPIPYKGQVLNQIAFRMMKATTDIVAN